MPYNSELARPLTSIVSYPERRKVHSSSMVHHL